MSIVKKPKKKTTSQLKKILDGLFSQYIRLKDSNGNGFCTCVTCGKSGHWKTMQNGHYISRQHLALRFDETNCHVQCPGCNVFKGGNYTSYALFMLNKYGEKRLQWLEQQKHVITKDYPYEEKITEYTTRIKNLENMQLQ